jgi:hypothetical protein
MSPEQAEKLRKEFDDNYKLAFNSEKYELDRCQKALKEAEDTIEVLKPLVPKGLLLTSINSEGNIGIDVYGEGCPKVTFWYDEATNYFCRAREGTIAYYLARLLGAKAAHSE